MNIFTKEKQAHLLSIFAGLVALVGVLTVFGFIALDAYIRWSLNQSFSFLSGDELPALTLASFGLLFGLVYLHRAHKE